LDIYLTTQHYSRLDVTLRILVEEFFIVETIFGKANNKKPFLGLKYIRWFSMPLEEIPFWENARRNPDLEYKSPDVYRGGFWFRKKFAIIYDTRQQVGRSETMPLVHKERECPICGKKTVSHY